MVLLLLLLLRWRRCWMCRRWGRAERTSGHLCPLCPAFSRCPSSASALASASPAHPSESLAPPPRIASLLTSPRYLPSFLTQPLIPSSLFILSYIVFILHLTNCCCLLLVVINQLIKLRTCVRAYSFSTPQKSGYWSDASVPLSSPFELAKSIGSALSSAPFLLGIHFYLHLTPTSLLFPISQLNLPVGLSTKYSCGDLNFIILRMSSFLEA